MTKVLFICYSFAPKNAAGTFRSVHFVKELPKLGYEPIIITTDEDSILRSGGSIDYSISKRLPESTKIIRISDPQVSFNKWSRLRLYRLFWTLRYEHNIDVYSEWSESIIETSVELIQTKTLPLIYISCAPFSAALAGLKIKAQTQVKLVVDFRDPFTDAYGNVFPGTINWNIARKIERRIIEGTDVLIVNTHEVKNMLSTRYPNYADKIKVITNGY